MRKKKKTGREALEEALRKSFADYHRQFPDSEEEIHLGKDYENYMDGLIRRSKNPTPLHFRTAWGRAACVAAAVLIAFTCSMTVSAVRTPFVNFLTNAYDQFTEILFDDADIEKAPSTIETVYTLGYVPEGYVEKDCNTSAISVYIIWENEKGEQIVFEQRLLDNYITIDNENADYDLTFINDTKIIYMSDKANCYYYWNSNEYCFYLELPNAIAFDAALDLINSIKNK